MAADLPYSMIRKAKDVTGWPDSLLAQIVGRPRPTVTAIIAGKFAEYLDARQIQALVGAVELYRDQITEGLEELKAFT